MRGFHGPSLMYEMFGILMPARVEGNPLRAEGNSPTFHGEQDDGDDDADSQKHQHRRHAADRNVGDGVLHGAGVRRRPVVEPDAIQDSPVFQVLQT